MDIFTQSFILQTQTILLADDDGDDISIFKDAISDFQITINLHAVENGLDAIQMLNQLVTVDIIFLDINMVLMNGFECLAEIRKQSQTLPVIMLSTSNDELNVAKSKTLGANGFITKPINLNQYRKTIKKVLATEWTKRPTHFYLELS